MRIVIDLAANFILVLGFGILLQAPRTSLISVGLTGTISWGGFLIASNFAGGVVFATFIAAITVGICGEVFARLHKLPATVFIVAGFLPLDPGVPAYYMMYHMIKGDYLRGVEAGVNTLIIAGAISFGIAFVGGAARYYVGFRNEESD